MVQVSFSISFCRINLFPRLSLSRTNQNHPRFNSDRFPFRPVPLIKSSILPLAGDFFFYSKKLLSLRQTHTISKSHLGRKYHHGKRKQIFPLCRVVCSFLSCTFILSPRFLPNSPRTVRSGPITSQLWHRYVSQNYPRTAMPTMLTASENSHRY
jgi:hypothetical protein